MRTRSSLGLAVLLLSASCVPPMALSSASGSVAKLPRPAGPPIPLMPAIAPQAEINLASLTAATPFTGPAQDADDAQRALDCLTAAVYYEARSESIEGQEAVAQVVLNRVRSPAFPSSICGVVYQGSSLPTGCQFSFTCDGSLGYRREPAAWERARVVAQAALGGNVFAPVGTATFYHTTAISPWWAPSLTPVTTIGAHIFYRWPNALGTTVAFNQAYSGSEPMPGAGEAAASDTMAAVMRYTIDGETIAVHRGPTQTMFAESARVAGVQVHFGNGSASAANHDTTKGEAPTAATTSTAVSTPQDASDMGVTIHRGPQTANAGAPSAPAAKSAG